MGFNVFIVTGPRRAGKSSLIAAMIAEACSGQPHYIRLATTTGTKKAPSPPCKKGPDCGVATATWVQYDPVRVFETLPEVLSAVHRKDRNACVILEADTDPNLRHAYPYDCQLFVMPAPASIHEVFRTPTQAQRALQSVLHDTAAFAGEIYGMFAEPELGTGTNTGHEPRPDMSDSQIVRLLHTPLGLELASRIQCQPPYHGLIESNMVVVNTGVGGMNTAVDEVVHRLEKLVRHTRPSGPRWPAIFCCDARDPRDPRRQRLIEHLRDTYAHHD